jgi:hypothetical protein
MPVGPRRALLSGRAPWALPGSTLDLDFLHSRAAVRGRPNSLTSLLTNANSTGGYVTNSAGLLTLVPANTLRISDLGLLVEQSSSCIALQNRDLTNANWTASNITAAKDQIGPDAIVNSASSILATANNGTITAAAITSASASRSVTMYVRRLTGTGAVSISQDGGATYTDISTKVSTSWYRPTVTDFAGLNQTVTNPQIVIKLATSGDKIAVDFVDLRALAIIMPSPIATTTVAVTQSADAILLAGPALTAALASKAAFTQTNKLNQNAATTTDAMLYFAGAPQQVRFAGNTVVVADNGAATAQATIGGSGTWSSRVKAAFGYDATSITAIANAGTQVVTVAAWGTPSSTVSVGNRSTDNARAINGFFERLAFGVTKGQFDLMTSP